MWAVPGSARLLLLLPHRQPASSDAVNAGTSFARPPLDASTSLASNLLSSNLYTCTPHALNPHTLTPHAFNLHAFNPHTLNPLKLTHAPLRNTVSTTHPAPARPAASSLPSTLQRWRQAACAAGGASLKPFPWVFVCWVRCAAVPASLASQLAVSRLFAHCIKLDRCTPSNNNAMSHNCACAHLFTCLLPFACVFCCRRRGVCAGRVGL
jgi:hypothetical protein